MNDERTFSIIKPDAARCKARQAGAINLARIEQVGLRRGSAIAPEAPDPLRGRRLLRRPSRSVPSSAASATFMSVRLRASTMVLEARKRDRRPAARSWAPPTRPRPPPGTIRKDFAESIEANSHPWVRRTRHGALRDRLLLPRGGALVEAQ